MLPPETLPPGDPSVGVVYLRLILIYRKLILFTLFIHVLNYHELYAVLISIIETLFLYGKDFCL